MAEEEETRLFRLALTDSYAYLGFTEVREYADESLGYFPCDEEPLAMRALHAAEHYVELRDMRLVD